MELLYVESNCQCQSNLNYYTFGQESQIPMDTIRLDMSVSSQLEDFQIDASTVSRTTYLH